MNFLRRLALQEENLDDSSRLDVVEIAGVADMLPKLVSFLFGLRTYQHPLYYVLFYGVQLAFIVERGTKRIELC